MGRDTVLSETGVTELGWASDEVTAGTEVVGISHPAGSPQRIATGSTTDEALFMTNNSRYVTVQWNDGTVEPGSSGSGLFLPDGTFVGVLSAGLDVDRRPGISEQLSSILRHLHHDQEIHQVAPCGSRT